MLRRDGGGAECQSFRVERIIIIISIIGVILVYEQREYKEWFTLCTFPPYQVM